MPNFIKIGETTLEKSVTIFLHPSIFWLHHFRWLDTSIPCSSYMQNFVLFHWPLSDISAAKLRRFCCWCDSQKTDQQKSASVTDWCMSPHGIAEPLNQSSPNSGNKYPLARPIIMQKFCGDQTRSVRDIRGRKFVLPEQVDQSSPKFFTGDATHQSA